MNAKNNLNKNIDAYYPWIVVTTGFFLVLILYGSFYSFGVFFKPMLEEFGCSRAKLTGAVSVYMAVHGASAILMGFLSDKYGPRWVIATGVLLLAAGYCMVSRITDPWYFYIYYGVMVGIGMGAAYVPPVSTVAKWFVHRAGLALGIVAAGVSAGQMVLPPLMRHLITLYGWRTSYVILGLIICVVGIPPALLLRHPPANHNNIPDKYENRKVNGNHLTQNNADWSVKNAVMTSSFGLLLCIFIALVIGVTTITTHLVAHLEDIGFEPLTASFVLTLIGGSGLFGRISIGGLADKISYKTLLPACLLPQALLLFGLTSASDLWIFYIIAAGYGFLYGGTLPVIIKMSSMFFGVGSQGAIFGILFFGATAGGAIGAPLAGYIYDVTNNYTVAFLIVAIVVLSGSLLSFIIKPPEKKTIKPEIKQTAFVAVD